jgi:hypothetical protein
MYKGLKNFTPCWDLNPGTSVLEVDAMTTMPRRQGNLCKLISDSFSAADPERDCRRHRDRTERDCDLRRLQPHALETVVRQRAVFIKLVFKPTGGKIHA